MRASRTVVNLVAVIVASAVLVLYLFTQLIAGAVLQNTYPLFVELPNAGGLIPTKEVTYRGVSVGVVDDVVLSGEGVRVQLGIDRGVRIPREVEIVVLRRSAVGEQAIDLRPPRRVTDATSFYEPEDTLVPLGEPVLPPRPQDLLVLADRVFAPVDPESASTVVAELANAVEGRRDDIRAFMADSASFSEAVADNGPAYDRLFAASRVVNASLAENRETLARLLTDLADGAQLLEDLRPDLEGVLASAPPALDLVSGLLERGQADLSCDFRYLANLNEYVARPENLANAAEALRVNQYFFQGFERSLVADPRGFNWARLHMVSEPQPPPSSYLPERRPIPDILPGGACDSPFGAGAPSATQAGYTVAVPEVQIVRPPNDRTEGGFGGASGGPGTGPVVLGSIGGSGSGATSGSSAGAVPGVALPATGGGVGSLVAGLFLLVTAVLLARARRSPRRPPDEDDQRG